MQLAERYGTTPEHFYAHRNLINLIALIDILNVQNEIREEAYREQMESWRNQLN